MPWTKRSRSRELQDHHGIRVAGSPKKGGGSSGCVRASERCFPGTDPVAASSRNRSLWHRDAVRAELTDRTGFWQRPFRRTAAGPDGCRGSAAAPNHRRPHLAYVPASGHPGLTVDHLHKNKTWTGAIPTLELLAADAVHRETDRFGARLRRRRLRHADSRDGIRGTRSAEVGTSALTADQRTLGNSFTSARGSAVAPWTSRGCQCAPLARPPCAGASMAPHAPRRPRYYDASKRSKVRRSACR
ncbi:hypothetical protein NORO109296_22250 [Nocardiopsis rhodophaea]